MHNLFLAKPSWQNSVIWPLLFTTVFVWISFNVFIASPFCKSAHAAGILPTDFCLVTEFDIEWTGGGTETNLPVRITWDTASLFTQSGINEESWDLRPVIGSFSNEVFIEVNDFDDTSTILWAIVPTIDNNQTLKLKAYSGANNVSRDAGIWFGGNENIIVPDDNILDTSGLNNLQIDLWFENENEIARDEIILDKRTAANGYEIQFTDVASVLNLQFEINTGSCAVAWNPSWTGEYNKYTFIYTNSESGIDTVIFVNDVAQASCDIDEGSVGASTHDLTFGEDAFDGSNSLNDVALKQVTIFDNFARILKYTFNASDMSETIAVNPFEGTIADHSGNGFTGTYTFNRDQSGITVVNYPSQLVSTTLSAQVIQDVEPIDVLGNLNAENTGFSDKNTTSIFYKWFIEPMEGAGPADWFVPTMALSILGYMMGLGVFLKTDKQFTPFGMFLTSAPVLIGGLNGWTPWWFIFMYLFLQYVTWWGVRRVMQNTP